MKLINTWTAEWKRGQVHEVKVEISWYLVWKQDQENLANDKVLAIGCKVIVPYHHCYNVKQKILSSIFLYMLHWLQPQEKLLWWRYIAACKGFIVLIQNKLRFAISNRHKNSSLGQIIEQLKQHQPSCVPIQEVHQVLIIIVMATNLTVFQAN